MGKKLKVVDQAACYACKECVVACSETFYKVFDESLSCIQIGTKKDGKTIKTNVCVQCGKCAKACTHEAIKQNAKGVYMVDKKKCVGCGDCVAACPFGLMILKEEGGTASKCIACGKCAKNCPMEVLEVVEA